MMMSSKECTKCKQIQPLERFYKCKRGLKSWCKDCENAANKLRYQKNKEHIRTQQREYYKTIAAKHNKASRVWYKNNKARHNKVTSLYAKNNRPRMNALKAKRRACELSATPSWADLEAIKKIYVESKKISDESGIVHHVDHIVPLQGVNICGLHVDYNLQILTATENLRKGNKYEQTGI